MANTPPIITDPFDNDQLDIALSMQSRGIGLTDARQIDAAIKAMEAQALADGLTATMKAAYLKGFIDQSNREIKALVEGATTTEARAALLPKVERISAQIEASLLQLEALADNG